MRVRGNDQRARSLTRAPRLRSQGLERPSRSIMKTSIRPSRSRTSKFVAFKSRWENPCACSEPTSRPRCVAISQWMARFLVDGRSAVLRRKTSSGTALSSHSVAKNPGWNRARHEGPWPRRAAPSGSLAGGVGDPTESLLCKGSFQSFGQPPQPGLSAGPLVGHPDCPVRGPEGFLDDDGGKAPLDEERVRTFDRLRGASRVSLISSTSTSAAAITL